MKKTTFIAICITINIITIILIVNLVINKKETSTSYLSIINIENDSVDIKINKNAENIFKGDVFLSIQNPVNITKKVKIGESFKVHVGDRFNLFYKDIFLKPSPTKIKIKNENTFNVCFKDGVPILSPIDSGSTATIILNNEQPIANPSCIENGFDIYFEEEGPIRISNRDRSGFNIYLKHGTPIPHSDYEPKLK